MAFAMQCPEVSELLDIWDAGADRSAADRCLRLLAAGRPECGTEALLDLSLGARDLQLFELRELLFGSDIEGVGRCPRCEERFEVSFSLDDIRAPARTDGPDLIEFEVGAYKVACRPLSSRDLRNIDRSANVEEAQKTLFASCLVRLEHAGEPLSAGDAPREVVEAVERAIERLDAQANVELLIDCEDCGHSWAAPFDIASYLWSEIDTRARRTLRDVHSLAYAYGWSEQEILALSDQRRRHYLEMAYGG